MPREERENRMIWQGWGVGGGLVYNGFRGHQEG